MKKKIIENDSSRNYEASRLTFNQFKLSTVLEKGARLIGSEGTEFDCLEETPANDDSNLERDRLLRQRMLLNEKLGLSKAGSAFGLNINDLVTLDDMRNNGKKYDPNKSLLPVQEVLNLDVKDVHGTNGDNSGASASLSRREMNRARRKARQQQIVTTSSGNTNTTNSINSLDSNNATFSRCNSTSNGSLNDDQPEAKKIKLETEILFNSNGK